MSQHLTETGFKRRLTNFLPRLGLGLLWLFILGLSTTNVLLIKQNQILKSRLEDKEPEHLKTGDHVPTLLGHKLSGDLRIIDFADSPKTVMFVFAPGCVPCEHTAPYWKKIEGGLIRNNYRSFALGLGDASEGAAFANTVGLASEVVLNLDSSTRNAFKLNITPLTIVVDNNGNVDKIWMGALSERDKSELEKFLGLESIAVNASAN